MTLSSAKKKRIWEASDHRCTYCRMPLTYDSMTIDHITPIAKMKIDANAESNLCVACKTCNTAKAAMSLKDFSKWVHKRNNELLMLESARRTAIARAEELSKMIEAKKYAYIHHLRKQLVKF